MKKTILVTTYSPCIHASYGIVARKIIQKLYDSGKYNIIHHGWFHAFQQVEVPWKVIPTEVKLVNGRHELDESDIHGQKSFEKVIQQVKPDIVWALGDFYMLKHVFDQKAKYPSTQFICYLAVDGEPWGPGHLNHVGSADEIVAISKYGSEIISSITKKDVPYIYHGVDPNVIYRMPESERHSLRSSLIPKPITEKTFIAGFIGKNQFRKMPWKIWEYTHYLKHGDYITCQDCGKVTLKEWDKVHLKSRDTNRLRMHSPGYDYSTCSHCNSSNIVSGVPNNDFYFYIHMPFRPNDPWNPDHLSHMWDVKDRILFTKNISYEKGLAEGEMNKIYNFLDMLYLPTGGEGFGIPVIESMRCKIPVMTTNYSSNAELCEEGRGMNISCDFFSEMNSCYDRALIKTDEAIKQTNLLLTDGQFKSNMIDKAYEFTDKYTWDKVSDEWADFISKIANRSTKAIGVIV